MITITECDVECNQHFLETRILQAHNKSPLVELRDEHPSEHLHIEPEVEHGWGDGGEEQYDAIVHVLH